MLGEVFPAGLQPVDPSLIIGRERELLDVLHTLDTPGLSPMIFGPRGIGKSVLAWQARSYVAHGEEVIEEVASNVPYATTEVRYQTIWINASNLKSSTGPGILDSLAEQLRRGREVVEGAERREQQQRLDEITKNIDFRFSALPFGLAVGAQYDRRVATSVEEEILNLSTEINIASGRPLLFILDDLDAVRDTREFSLFLKNASWISPSGLRFMLVGTAVRPGDLLADFSDLGPIVIPVELQAMATSDLLRMLTRAAQRFSERDRQFRFEEGILDSIAIISAGYPLTAAQLARDAIRAAEKLAALSVTRECLDAAIRELVYSLRSPVSADRHRY